VKKLLVGCLVILVLGAVLFGVAAYFLYRAASPVIQNARETIAGWSELERLDDSIEKKDPFNPPASNELTQAQVDRFVRVQEHVRTTLGQRMKDIETKYENLNREQGRDPTFGESMQALRELAGVFIEARRIQVDALNKEGFSQDEYSWVRERVFQAAGIEVASRMDFRKLEEAIRSGTGIEKIETPNVPKPNVPERNRALVKPHLDKMDEWLPLVFFGL
jgi:hypothetical protein